MAINSTFSSIVNEIQLSNLSFTSQLTPFAAYNNPEEVGSKRPAWPPFHPLSTTPVSFALRDENSKLAAVDDLTNKYEQIVHENEALVISSKEAHTKVSNVNASNYDLQSKIHAMKNYVTRYLSEKVKTECKLKDTTKKHMKEINELRVEVKTLNKLLKGKDKANYDLTKNLEYTRETVKKIKLEKSNLKTRTTKLEENVRKLEKQINEKNKHVKA